LVFEGELATEALQLSNLAFQGFHLCGWFWGEGQLTVLLVLLAPAVEQARREVVFSTDLCRALLSGCELLTDLELELATKAAAAYHSTSPI
jgi:hypothetical protein